jgi:branched-chain amino acid aminotransferase
MPHFDECFVVGTAAEVTPVREIDGHAYRVGEICHALASDYDNLVRGKLDIGV